MLTDPGRRTSARRGLVYAVSAGAMTAFAVPLAATPAQAAAAGHAAAASSLLATIFLVGIVAGELCSAAVLARIGERAAIIAGLALLGLPSLVFAASDDVTVWAVCSAARGLGFALVVIAAAAVVAAGAADGHLGSELGWYGLVAGVPSIIGLPLGLHLGETVGFGVVHLLAATAALAAIPAAAALSHSVGDQRRGRTEVTAARFGLGAIVRSRGAVGLAAALAAAAAANGVFVVFVPLTDRGAAGAGGVIALAAVSFGAPVARVVAGRLGDRMSAGVVLAPGLALTAGGLVAAALAADPGTLAIAAFTSGFGFGAVQNATLQSLCAGRPARELGAASALWNLSYDLGLAIGTLGFAVLALAVAPQVAATIAGLLLLPAAGAAVLRLVPSRNAAVTPQA